MTDTESSPPTSQTLEQLIDELTSSGKFISITQVSYTDWSAVISRRESTGAWTGLGVGRGTSAKDALAAAVFNSHAPGYIRKLPVVTSVKVKRITLDEL